MSTRSIVYAKTAHGTKGVYVHWDGKPRWRIPTLKALIAEHGLDTTISTVLGKPNGWSHLDNKQVDELPEGHRDGRFQAIPGFGVRFTDANHYNNTPEYVSPDERGWDIEYLYLIEPDGSVKWTVNWDGTWGSLRWNTTYQEES